MHEQMHRLPAHPPKQPQPAAKPRMPVRRPLAPAAEPPSITVQRKCGACTADEELKRKTEPGGGEHGTAPAIVGDVIGSGGQPLSAEERAYFEPRLGRAFGDVRIHTDARADASARAVNAVAYTVGHDIVFRQGAFVPRTESGKRLLAHELAHVAQGSPGAAAQASEGGLRVSHPDDTTEREADRVADSVVRGDCSSPRDGVGAPSAKANAATLHREPAEELPAEPVELGPESGVRPKVPTGFEPKPGPGFWGRVGQGFAAVGALVTGPLLVGLATIAAILTYSSKTAPRWKTELNPITGKAYTSPEEFEEVSHLPPEEIERRKKEQATPRRGEPRRDPKLDPKIEPPVTPEPPLGPGIGPTGPYEEPEKPAPVEASKRPRGWRQQPQPPIVPDVDYDEEPDEAAKRDPCDVQHPDMTKCRDMPEKYRHLTFESAYEEARLQLPTDRRNGPFKTSGREMSREANYAWHQTWWMLDGLHKFSIGGMDCCETVNVDGHRVAVVHTWYAVLNTASFSRR